MVHQDSKLLLVVAEAQLPGDEPRVSAALLVQTHVYFAKSNYLDCSAFTERTATLPTCTKLYFCLHFQRPSRSNTLAVSTVPKPSTALPSTLPTHNP
jgi:hypothetical protein